MPEPLTISIASGIISSLAANMLQNAGVKLRKTIHKSGQEEALRRCTQAGVASFLGVVETNSQEETDHLDTVFRAFFAKPEVGEELAMLLEGELPDQDVLMNQFEQAGFVVEQLPGVNFSLSMTAFQQTFIVAAAGEGELAGTIQALSLIKRTGIPKQSLEVLKQIAAVLKAIKSESLQAGSAQAAGMIEGEEVTVDFHKQLLPYFAESAKGGDDYSIHIEGSVSDSVIISGDGNTVKKIFSFGNYYEAGAESAEQNDTAARENYLKRLIRRCQLLPLSALGEDTGINEELTLDKVYIDLDTRSTRMPTRAELEKLDKAGKDVTKNTIVPVTVLETAKNNKHLLLLGDPGSGKSTFVRQFCVYTAQKTLVSTSGLVPVFINLRDFCVHLLPSEFDGLPGKNREVKIRDTFKKQVRREFRELESESYFSAFFDKIDAGKCLLVLDGLDEVPFIQRELIQETVRTIINSYSPQHVIITCRIRSYTDAYQLTGFSVYTIDPFNSEKIELFIRGWYNAQRRLNRFSSTVASQKAVDLIKAARSDFLKGFSGNPMLLTSMAIIHQRDVGLPDRRVQLYQRAVEILLRRWRRQQSGDHLSVSNELAKFLNDDVRLRRSIERLAYEAHHTQQSGQTRGDLERGFVLTILEEDRYLGDIALAKEFMDYVDQHSGLLIGRGGNIVKPQFYGFPHRTFQEYLAGCYLVSHREATRKILELTFEGDYWSTAVQLGFEELCYNRLQENELLDFAYRFCTSAEAANIAEERRHLWASNIVVLLGRSAFEQDVLDGCSGITFIKRLQSALVKRLSGDLPPSERAHAGRNLAELGDPRIEIMTLDNLRFCLVKAGLFWMGAAENDKQAHYREKPLRLIKTSYDYWLSEYPISNLQYQTFVHVDGYDNADYWFEAIAANRWASGKLRTNTWDGQSWQNDYLATKPFDYGERFNLNNQPVVGISWYEAMAFCAWLTSYWRERSLLPEYLEVRLPTEIEWEKSSRGGIKISSDTILKSINQEFNKSKKDFSSEPNLFPQRIYPWGEKKVSGNILNYQSSGIGSTSTLGCFAKDMSPHGNVEMVGNVREFCLDKWQGSYDKEIDDSVDVGCENRVLRGGSWVSYGLNLRCSNRCEVDAYNRHDDTGFRIGLFPSLKKG